MYAALFVCTKRAPSTRLFTEAILEGEVPLPRRRWPCTSVLFTLLESCVTKWFQCLMCSCSWHDEINRC